MADIPPTKSLDIHKELANLELYKYHPNGILNVSLNRLQDMLDGKVVLSDPSNPFTYLLETSCLNTAFAVQEFAVLTRKLYPRLANTDKDLYLHMSDKDYLGRFCEPSWAKVSFNILFNDFKSKARFDPVLKEYVLKLPRHLKVVVGIYSYMLTSAIVIRQTANDVVDVRFENQDFNNIFAVETNHINHALVKTNQSETYLVFELKLPEVDIEVFEFAVDTSAPFHGSVAYKNTRQFYYLRAFYYQNSAWKEMLVTHTNEVYDINTPTCMIQVLPGSSEVHYQIPAIYFNTKQISRRVRILAYTSLGDVSVNFADYKFSDFESMYADIFPEEELDVYTTPLELIPKVIYATEQIKKGKNGKSFEQLKHDVIHNSIGDRNLPITQKQLTFSNAQTGFRTIKDEDTISSRVYKLEAPIPSPATRYPITKTNLDIIEIASSVYDLREGNAVKFHSEHITVLPEGTLFELREGILTLLSPQEAENVKNLSGISLTQELNQRTYLYLYYHYVLSTGGNTVKLLAYDLQDPVVSTINFKEFNATARIGLNTTQANLYKSHKGYTLDVLGNLKKYTDTISEGNVIPYLVYKDSAGALFYLASTFHTKLNGQPVYRFELLSSYHIDDQNDIHFTNFVDSNGQVITLHIPLSARLHLLYVSDTIPTTYESSSIDAWLVGSVMGYNHCAVALEDIVLRFGKHLDRLYTRAHSSAASYDYERYEADVVLRYKQTVYNQDNEIIHQVGDIVYDETGAAVIEHRRGDVVLDPMGQNKRVDPLTLVHYLNFMLGDYRAKIATDESTKLYHQSVRRHFTDVCLGAAESVQQELLDNSEAYVVVPKTVGYITVQTGTAQRSIASMQSFSVDVYVRYDIYNNALVRESMSYTIVKTVDEYLYDNTVLKKTQLLNLLYAQLKEFVESVSISQFTELNAEYIQLLDTNSRVSLKKTLSVQASGYQLQEDIKVNFHLV